MNSSNVLRGKRRFFEGGGKFGRLAVSIALCAGGRAWGQVQDPPLLTMARCPQSTALCGGFSSPSIGALDALGNGGLYDLVSQANVAVSHQAFFQGSNYDALGLVYPTLNWGTFGAGFYNLRSAAAETRDANGSVVGSFADSSRMLRAGYGHFVGPDLSLGGNFSVLNHDFAGYRSGFAVADVGAQYNGIDALSLGIVVDNFAYTRMGDTDDNLTQAVRLNAAYALWKDTVLLGGEVSVQPTPVQYRLGIAYSVTRGFGLRFGRSRDVSVVGVGLKFSQFHLDYNLGMTQLGTAHQLTLSTSFLSPRVEIRGHLAKVLYARARTLAEKGRYDQALEALKKAERYQYLPADMRVIKEGLLKLQEARIPPLTENSDTQALMRRGISLFLENKPELAQDVFFQIQAKDPNNMMIRTLLAMSGWRENTRVKREDTAPSLPSFTDIDPVRLKMFKVDQYFQKQEWDLALKECKDVLTINPKEVLAYVRMGSIFYAVGMQAKAFESWRYAEGLAPNDPNVRKAVQFMNQAMKKRAGGGRQ